MTPPPDSTPRSYRNPFTGDREPFDRADDLARNRERVRRQRGGLHAARVRDPELRRASDRRKRDRARLAREIIAWDGEGLEAAPGAAQPYVLLKSSVGGRVLDLAGLSTRACLSLLLATAATHPEARHVAFGISYDVNQWLRDVPDDRLRELYRTGACWWGDYRLEYRPRRSFYAKHLPSGRRITVVDVQTWYGGSLQSALRRWIPRHRSTATIARMKARRRAFRAEELPAIEAYCDLELAATVELVQLLLESLTAVGLRPARLDGPGGAAARLLQDAGIKAHLPAEGEQPERVTRAALIAYSGGRIEPLRFGAHHGGAWEYDLHSAYPWAMLQLPTLAGGRWKYSSAPEGPIEPWALYRVRWSQVRAHGVGASSFYPFAWRDRTGGIFYPSAGEAWIWGPEVAAYMDHRDLFDCGVELVGAWRFVPADRAARPFAFLGDLYRARRAAGPREAEVLKASMVAVYGKLVQTVGWRDDPPPYYSIVWGGLVTSYIRARLLHLAARDPGAVVMFATDAVYTTRRVRLPHAEAGDAIGRWGEQRVEALTVVQSGVYLVRRDGRLEAMTRGYAPRDLAATPARQVHELERRVLAGWRAGAEHVEIPQSRFISLASWQELAPGPPAWRSWMTDGRELALYPQGKRTGGDGDPARGLVRSLPTPIVENLSQTPMLSTAYSRTWRPSPQALVEGVSPAVYEEEVEESVY